MIIKKIKRLAALLLAGAVLCAAISFGLVNAYAQEPNEIFYDDLSSQDIEIDGDDSETLSDEESVSLAEQEYKDDIVFSGSDFEVEKDDADDVGNGSIYREYSGTCGSNLTWEVNSEGTVLTISGTGDMYSYETAPWGTVVEGGVVVYEPWGDFCGTIQSISIGYGVTSIGAEAFAYINNITSISIPDTVSKIGGGAFEGCSRLSVVYIPNGITTIEYRTFKNCVSLDSIAFIDGVERIKREAFKGCKGLKHISIPNGVKEITGDAFADCPSLESVYIPESVTTLGSDYEQPFTNCQALKSITVAEHNPVFDSRNSCNAIVKSESNTIITGCMGTVIPKSVTSLGWDSFMGSGLTSIVIPENICEMRRSFRKSDALEQVIINGKLGFDDWERAFTKCKNLKSVTLGENVTYIDDGAFEECSSLVSVELPKSVITVGKDAFKNCTSLVEVRSLQIIKCEWGAFHGCISLVSIPHIEEHDCYLFYGCTSLDTVILDDMVKGIARYEFENCSSLKSLVIPVNAQYIGYCALDGCSDLTDIYYGGSEDEWESIDIDDGNEILDDVTIHFEYDGKSFIQADGTRLNLNHLVPKGRYGICVLDANDKPLGEAVVKYDTQEQITGEDGYVEFDIRTNGKPVIEATKEGYYKWSNEGSCWKSRRNRYEEIRLYDENSSEGLMLSAAYTIKENQCEKDILHESCKVSLPNCRNESDDNTNTILKIACSVYNPTAVQEYMLMQGNEVLAISRDGIFEVNLTEDPVVEGGDVYILVYSKNTIKSYKNPLNLKFVTVKYIENTSFEFDRKGVKFQVNDDIPFIGGSTQKLKFPASIPVQFKVAENEIRIGLNYQTLDTAKRAWSKYVSKNSDMRNLANDIRNADLESISDYMISKNKCHLFNEGLPDLDYTFVGYLEADLESSVASGTIFMVVEAKDLIDIQYNCTVPVVVPIPVTVQISLDMKLEGGAKGGYDFRNKELTGFLYINIEGDLEAFGGIGISKLTGAGGYGEAKLTLEWKKGKDGGKEVSGLQSAELVGELGFKAYLGPWEGEKIWARRTWTLYKASGTADEDEWTDAPVWAASSLDKADSYVQADLSYLESESDWQEETEGVEALNAALGQMSLNNLLSGTFQNAQPETAVGDNGIYLTMLRADEETGRIYTTVSRYNGSTWSEPIELDQNAVLDDAPNICVDTDGHVWVTYTRVDDLANDDYKSSILGYAKNRELVVSRLNPISLAVEEEKVYEGSDYIHGQDIANIDDSVILTWIDSEVTTDDDVLSPKNNSLYMARATNGEWGDSRLMREADGRVVQLMAGMHGENSDGVAYTIASETDDSKESHSLYWTDGSDEELLADVGAGFVKFDHLPGKEEKEFIWNGSVKKSAEDGDAVLPALVGSSGDSVVAEGITSYYDVAGDSLFYSTGAIHDSEGQYKTYLKEVSYEDGTYTDDVLQLSDTRYFEDLNAEVYQENNYLVGMNTSATIGNEDLQISKDLVWGRSVDISNLEISSIACDQSDVVAGEELPVTVTLKNCGANAISRIKIDVNGENTTKECNLDMGEEKEISFTMTYPDSETEYLIAISEDGKINASENNKMKIILASPDLSVDAELHLSGAQKGIEATVSNIGGTSASGLVILQDNAGSTVASQKFENLGAGENLILQFWIPQDETGQYVKDISAIVEMSGKEKNVDNNVSVVNLCWGEKIDESEPEIEPEDEQFLIMATAGIGGKISPEGESIVDSWDDLDFDIVPDDDYKIDDVLVDGESVGAVSEYSFEDIDSNHTIEAYFAPKSIEYGIYPGDLLDEEKVPNGFWTAVSINPNSEDGLYYYSGQPVKPVIRVYNGSKRLHEGKDYSLKYSNNTKAYTLSEDDQGFYNTKGKTSAPSVTVSGKGNYSGKEIVYFKIYPIDISTDNELVFCDPLSVGYNKKNQKPVPSLIWNGAAIKKKTAFTVEYYTVPDGGVFDPNNPGDALSSVKAAGNYIMRIRGKGNYTGVRDVELRVVGDTHVTKLVQKLNFSKISAQKYKGGTPICPQITVYDGRKKLTPRSSDSTDDAYSKYDYEVSYFKNTEVGTAYVLITGNPERGYSGTKRISFKINGTSLKNATVKGLPASVAYTGKETLFDDEIALGTVSLTPKGETEPLALYDQNTGMGDFKVSYKNNLKAGKATVIFAGTNGYMDSIKKTVKIVPVSLNDASVSVTCGTFVSYQKGGTKASVVVKFNNVTLVEGRDYTLTYKNYTKLGQTASVSIKGKGNFKDIYATRLKYEIIQQNLTYMNFTAPDIVYKNKNNIYPTKVVITDRNGKRLKAGIDYEKKLDYRYAFSTTVTQLTGKTIYQKVERNAEDPVDAKDIIPAGTIIKVTITGKGAYKGTMLRTYKITKASIAKAKITISKKVYTGKYITLNPDDISVMIDGKRVLQTDPGTGSTNWWIGAYANNIEKGKASVIIRGEGDYGDYKVANFTIASKGLKWWWRELLSP